MDRIIEVKVYGNHLTKDSNNAGTRGEGNATKLRITFDKSWEGMAKTVVFWDANGQNAVSITLSAALLEGTSTNIYLVPIPQEAMARAGEMTFSIRGEGTGSRQVSISGKLEVEDSPEILAPIPPTPDQWNQMQSQYEAFVGDVVDINTAIKETIPALISDVETAKSEAAEYAEAAELSAANATGLAADAAESARIAGEAQTDAAGYAVDARNAADRAEATIGKTPYIGEDGMWYVWNKTSDAFINTDIKAQAGSTVYYGENPPEEADVWINPNGEATDIDPTYANTIVCEAEGESISINDSAEMQLKGLRVFGKTKQLRSTGKNLIPFPYYDGMRKEENGITFVVNDDGSITANGTATETAYYNIIPKETADIIYIPSGVYKFSTATDGLSAKCRIGGAIRSYSAGNSVASLLLTTAKDRDVDIPDSVEDAYIEYLQIVINKGYEVNNMTFHIMLEKGTVVTEYEPPTGGKPSPSPEMPQPMNSAGKDGNIGIEISNGDGSKSQAIAVDTPSGLRGVPLNPVASDDAVPIEKCRNYVDSNGVSWICDEIDLARGVYIKRIEEYTLDLSNLDGNAETGFFSFITTPFELLYAHPSGYCDRGVFPYMFDITGSSLEFYFDANDCQSRGITTADEVRELMDRAQMLLIRANPIEKPLSAEEIANYKKLKAYKPTTNINNDDGAHMAVEYIADAKTYIDNKFAELQKAMVANV